MGFHRPAVIPAKKLLRRSFSNTIRGASTKLADVPKGYFCSLCWHEQKAEICHSSNIP